MNWVTTNIRLPEDLYMDLKMRAVKERKSVAGVIRDKLSSSESLIKKRKNAQLLKKMQNLAKKIAKENKGINLTQAVIDSRYEQ